MSIIGIVGDAIGKVTGLIDDLHTSGEEKLEAKGALLAIQAEVTTKVLDYEATLAKEQGATIRAEMASGSWLATSWRPILMLTFGAVIVYSTVAPAFGAPVVDMSGVPDRMWSLMTVGVGGYVVGRTAEKIVPATFAAMKSREET